MFYIFHFWPILLALQSECMINSILNIALHQMRSILWTGLFTLLAMRRRRKPWEVKPSGIPPIDLGCDPAIIILLVMGDGGQHVDYEEASASGVKLSDQNAIVSLAFNHRDGANILACVRRIDGAVQLVVPGSARDGTCHPLTNTDGKRSNLTTPQEPPIPSMLVFDGGVRFHVNHLRALFNMAGGSDNPPRAYPPLQRRPRNHTPLSAVGQCQDLHVSESSRHPGSAPNAPFPSSSLPIATIRSNPQSNYRSAFRGGYGG
ncbi:hypothetical protein BD779DRAFT_1789609 [Infundibulicybe gibba]|nr:hypothetical protein BD779DRAFT_1789609 [Infundibulicybe gibba]